MIALIQRVSQAKVDVNGETIGKIGKGLLVLLGVEKEDNREKADKLAEKVLNYRIFSDENDKMNLNVQQAQGELLIVLAIYISSGYAKRFTPEFFKRCAPSIG
ncbi:D-aminoacyl-tRNA deacylase [Haemophilus influenzae]